jgi:hypothetical protein
MELINGLDFVITRYLISLLGKLFDIFERGNPLKMG